MASSSEGNPVLPWEAAEMHIILDLGTTGVVVSFVMQSLVEDMGKAAAEISERTVQNWPFQSSIAMSSSKVPALIAREKSATPCWGFQCLLPMISTGERTVDVQKDFKYNLYNEVLHKRSASSRAEEVHKHYRLFLIQVFQHAIKEIELAVKPKSYLGKQNRPSLSTVIHFTAPQTWSKMNEAEAQLRSVIMDAVGEVWKSNDPLPTVSRHISEGQCSALAELDKLGTNNQDDILVLDIGGSTVDICSVNVRQLAGNYIDGIGVSPGRAENLGLTMLDDDLEKHLESSLPNDPYKKGRIQQILVSENWKSARQEYSDQSQAIVALENDNLDQDLAFTTAELSKIFKDYLWKLKHLFGSILDQLKQMDENFKPKNVVITGGGAELTSVKELAELFFSPESNNLVKGGRLMFAKDPRKSVSCGLQLYVVHNIRAYNAKRPEWEFIRTLSISWSNSPGFLPQKIQEMKTQNLIRAEDDVEDNVDENKHFFGSTHGVFFKKEDLKKTWFTIRGDIKENRAFSARFQIKDWVSSIECKWQPFVSMSADGMIHVLLRPQRATEKEKQGHKGKAKEMEKWEIPGEVDPAKVNLVDLGFQNPK